MMCNEDPRSIRKRSVKKAALKQMVSNVSIDCRQRIVEQYHRAFFVRRASNADPLSLST